MAQVGAVSPGGEEPLDRVYGVLSGDDAADRACEAIPEEACTAVPRNFVLNVANGAASKLAEQLAGPNLVLPWLLAVLGAPVALVGMLMPVKQVGAMLPQMAVAGQIRRAARRKWFWVGASLVQCLSLLLMIPAAVLMEPLGAGVSIVLLLAVFSVASGTGSVAFQDVLGKTIPRGVRGRLLSARAAIGGALTTLAGLAIKFWLGGEGDLLIYLGLLLLAGALWALAGALFAGIEELCGATAGGRNAIEEAGHGIALVRRHPGYGRYLLARAALLSIELAVPFYVVHGRSVVGEGVADLGLYVVAVGLAQVLSSPFWGALSDLSSRRVMVYSGLMGASAAALALVAGMLPEVWHSPYMYGLVFLVIGLAEAGVRLGRKTYLVDAAPADQRPTYVAFANTLVGGVTLLAGGLGFVAQLWGIEVMIGMLLVLGLLGAAAAAALPEAHEMVGDG